MIKFFRPIRKSLMEKNKTGKYFKYAIGEIILVVIGILIALQINNWNETKKRRALEIETLVEIKQALAQDTLVLTKNIQTLITKKEQAKRLINHIENKKPHSKLMDSLALELYYHRGYKTFNTAAFELLKERGFGIIKNTELRKEITNHYTTTLSDILSILGRLEDVNLVQADNIYDNFRLTFGIIEAYDYDALLNDPKVFGPFYHLELINNAYFDNLSDFKSKTKDVLSIVNVELANREND